MSNKRLFAAGYLLVAGAVLALSFVTILMCAQWGEHRFFPVVDDFTVTTIEHGPKGVTISGVLNKQRDYRFLEVVAYAGEKTLEVVFLDSPNAGGQRSRATGWQTFGPWLISPDTSHVRIVARHRCHSLWDSTTVLTPSEKL